MREYSTIEAAQRISAPTLFIHGTNDDVIPCQASKDMCLKASWPPKIDLMSGTDHLYNFFDGESKVDEMIDYVRDWLKKFR